MLAKHGAGLLIRIQRTVRSHISGIARTAENRGMFIAGARGSHQFAVERLEQQFVKSARLLVPSREDWVYTGKLLGRLAIKYGYEQIGRGR
jgi:hypothetical protein